MTATSTSAVSALGWRDIRHATDAQLLAWLGESSDTELKSTQCSMIRIELRVRERDRQRHKGTGCE